MTTGQNTPLPPPGPQPSPPGTKPASTRQKTDRTALWAATITAAGAVLAAAMGLAGGWFHYSGPGSTAPSAPTASPLASAPANHGRPSANPTPADSPQSPATTGDTVYLANMNGEVAGDSDRPQLSQWAMLDTVYPNSIGYVGTDQLESIQYNLKGTHYSWFDATVGINDGADDLNQGEQFGFTVIMNPGDREYDYNAAWDSPTSIHLALNGATVLTLQTDTTGGIFSLFPESVALWGNARLTR
jgi:NPCBM/NEW2 domain